MFTETNTSIPGAVFQRIKSLECHCTELSFRISAEDRKIKDMQALLQKFPNDVRYLERFEQHQQRRMEYQQQYDASSEQVNDLKLLLLMLLERESKLSNN